MTDQEHMKAPTLKIGQEIYLIKFQPGGLFTISKEAIQAIKQYADKWHYCINNIEFTEGAAWYGATFEEAKQSALKILDNYYNSAKQALEGLKEVSEEAPKEEAANEAVA